jgi:predicted chitinase
MQSNTNAIMQSGNLYAYTMNNPVRWTDPTGRFVATIMRNVVSTALQRTTSTTSGSSGVSQQSSGVASSTGGVAGNVVRAVMRQIEPSSGVVRGIITGANTASQSRNIVSADQLIRMGWRNVTNAMVADLNYTLHRFDITTPARKQHFISQAAHESGLGLWVRELASGQAYEGRRDLGNVNPGDGPRFRGAGFLQLTGRYNYQRFADFMDNQNIMQGYTYVAANHPWLSAGFWWHKNNMNEFIDSGATLEQVTRRVNGGLNGLEDRQNQFRAAQQIWR